MNHGRMEALIAACGVVVIGLTVLRYWAGDVGLADAMIIATVAAALLFQVGSTHHWRTRAQRIYRVWRRQDDREKEVFQS